MEADFLWNTLAIRRVDVVTKPLVRIMYEAKSIRESLCGHYFDKGIGTISNPFATSIIQSNPR